MVLPGLVVCAILSTALGESPLAGPTFKNLRYDEDFSYLAGPPESYEKDRWDPIKWINISDDWVLSVGGQARLRMESETNKAFGGVNPVQDTFLLQRYFVHLDFIHGDNLRFFIQGKFAHANDRDRGGLAGMEDHADFHQAFVDITTPLFGGPVTFRLGRQELQYGAERLISPLDWGNTRRTFEGIKAFTELGDWRIDAFAVRPVLVDRRNLDDGDENVQFYGIYTTHKARAARGSDYYFLLLKNDNLLLNSNMTTGRQTVYTLGTRQWGIVGNWDWETEAAAQFGTFAGDRIRAWMATAGGGYMGYLDLVGRQNIHAVKAQLKVKPAKKITAWADFHTFFADQDKDSLYSAGAARIRAPGAGGAGSHMIGHELDITMKLALNRHTTPLIGWAHMWPGGFIDRTGPGDEPDLVYAQLEYKF